MLKIKRGIRTLSLHPMNLIDTKSFKLSIKIKGEEKFGKLAIVLPGRLDTKDYSCFESHLEVLASRGFYSIAFDPPGTWESPGDIDLFTTTNYIKAVHELIDYFGNKPTLLLGHSRGGTVSIIAGDSDPLAVGYVAIMSSYGEPFSPSKADVDRGYRVSYRDLPPGTEKTKEQKKFKLPINYFVDGQKYDASKVLEKSVKPKLLFYGADDEFTTVAEAEEVFEKTANPKVIHKLKSDHDYRYYPEVIREVNEAINQFLTDYILK